MTTNDSSTPKKAETAQVQPVRKEFTVSGDERNLDSGTRALSGQHSQAQMSQDARQLLEMVQRRPGRPANYYAVKLNLPHAYTRRLLVQLEQLGELDSKRVRVYRVALQRLGQADDRQGHPHDDQAGEHPAVRRPQGHQSEEGGQPQLTQAEIHPLPPVPFRHEQPIHEHGYPVHERQDEVPLVLLHGQAHYPCPITDDQGVHAETPGETP